jgi:hypothetical protein
MRTRRRDTNLKGSNMREKRCEHEELVYEPEYDGAETNYAAYEPHRLELPSRDGHGHERSVELIVFVAGLVSSYVLLCWPDSELGHVEL